MSVECFPHAAQLLHAGSMTQYSITVYTSEMQQAMSSTGGFAILHGGTSSSREVQLSKQTGSTFRAGAHDTWSTPEMQDLGPLQKLTVGLKEQVTA